MTNLREAAQMALDALEQVQEADTAGATPKMVMEARKLYEPTITALRAVLAQPEQEPVALNREYTKRLIEALYENSDPVSVDAADEFQRLLTTSPQQPEQKPVAWRNKETGEFCSGGFLRNQIDRWQPLYTAPPQREWQGLTDEEKYLNEARSAKEIEYAKAIEAKLKEKNI